jgi:hypothetical protein
MKPLLSFMVLIFLSGCHKSNSGYTGSGYWYVQQVYRPVQNYHPIQYTTRRDSAGILILTASTTPVSPNDSSNRISVWLGSLPADSELFGIYELSNNGVPAGLPGPRQLGISGLQDFGDIDPACPGWGNFHASIYSSMSTWPWTLADSATVSVSHGKIKVVIPQLLVELLDRCGNDSPAVRAVIQEK